MTKADTEFTVDSPNSSIVPPGHFVRPRLVRLPSPRSALLLFRSPLWFVGDAQTIRYANRSGTAAKVTATTMAIKGSIGALAKDLLIAQIVLDQDAGCAPALLICTARRLRPRHPWHFYAISKSSMSMSMLSRLDLRLQCLRQGALTRMIQQWNECQIHHRRST